VLAGVGAAAVCTGIGWRCRGWGDLSFFVMLFLVGAVGTALWRGRLASAVASILGMLCFDYFFESPAFSMVVENWPNFIVFTGFLAISQLVASLVHQLRLKARDAVERERETAALHSLAEALSAQASSEGLRREAERHLSALLKVPVRILPAGEFGIALTGSRGPLGTLAVEGGGPFLEACGRQVALALERALLAEEAERAHTKAELEHTRSTLLGAVSHDFRTPLSTIKGAAATLVQEEAIRTTPDLLDLATMIVDESTRLDHLVGNLLDMMRLDGGTLRPALELQPLEEVVGTVLTRLEPRVGPIAASLPDDLPLVPLDGVLVEQLLTNLLENAFRHGEGGRVGLTARALEGAVEVEVSDQGPGIPDGLRERVFEKFYRSPGASADGGVGLGLAICRAIVRLHGGRIWIEEAPGGGASFRFTLPLEVAP
jgi:two-component system sensor histidine kinase KdpD